MDDLFEREQHIYDTAISYIKERKDDIPFDIAQYEFLVREYGKLLKHLRMVTKISDRTTINLNTSKLNLLDKVHYDALTGIYNRLFLTEQLELMLKDQIGKSFSVLMADVDFFKRYNDTYGHNKGDKCLRKVAKALESLLKCPGAFVARFGGEEFVAIMPNTGVTDACEMAKKMITGIEALHIPHERNDVSDYVTISIGVTTGTVVIGQKGEDFVKRADKALYISKREGRNRYTFLNFTEETT